MDTKTLAHRKTHRTTLTLEADVVEYVEQKLAADKKLREKTVINDLLRKGIKLDEIEVVPEFRLKGFKSQLTPGITAEKLEALLDEV
jgi:hypothetical protein